ncbi:hypothetical protein KFK09_006318 [Dendrobium nobile]|uniref:PB1 domain-containing protein n=1 Tax=Dendrobium nobile TaxID=94219 RepID=A0A8T3BTB2_DENNO|nr:hypothetical protein KFK09_006318 [Dendrobium nobile]
MDYLDSSSSATSACLSQNDGSLQQTLPLSSFNQPSLFRSTLTDSDVQGTDLRNNTLFGVNIDVPLGVPLTNDTLLANSLDSGKYQNQLTGNPITNYTTSKDAQQELSSSMVSQSFGVPDMAFNSIDSSLTESSLLNRNSWGPSTQFQRMRTFTKVYKRGAVGRSLDITRYSGYDELKRDLARMFSIEGQLEERQRIGWKLVYIDHENDVLLCLTKYSRKKCVVIKSWDSLCRDEDAQVKQELKEEKLVLFYQEHIDIEEAKVESSAPIDVIDSPI